MSSNLESKLNNIKVKDLPEQSSAVMWREIWQTKDQYSIWSRFVLSLKNKPALALILALIIFFGASVTTVQAAKRSKPGDLLFPVEIAVENVQLAFSAPIKKNELRVKFSQERADEIADIIQKDKNKSGDKNNEEDIKTALNLLSEYKDAIQTSGDNRAQINMQQVVVKIEKALNNIAGPFELQLKFNKNNQKLKFRIEAEEDDGEIKFNFKTKKFASEDFVFATSTATSTSGLNHEEKIAICHVTGAGQANDLKIATSSLVAHLAHGDKLGECPEDTEEENNEQVTSTKTTSTRSWNNKEKNNQTTSTSSGNDDKDEDQENDKNKRGE